MREMRNQKEAALDERDIARKELQVLGDEKRVLKQELEGAIQEGINAEREIWELAECEKEVIRAEHDQQVSSIN